MGFLTEQKKQRKLTEKQEEFLNQLVLTGGDAKQAAELAGYSGNHYQVLKGLREEVLDLTTDVLSQSAPKAAFKLIEIMDSDRPIPQANNKLTAATTILDRVGVAKKERLDINHTVSGGLFILPEKNTIDLEEAEIVKDNDE